jgi:dihydrofolate synthase / folylpolyglutamate synthase
MMNFNDAVKNLTSQEKFHINLGLERVFGILELLENPQNNLKFIHVAGTNGKGSVCAMLSAILTEAGYKTGLYTSPHLVDYTERIKTNNIDISKQEFSKIFEKIHEIAQKNNIPLTEFEILTVMAFEYFLKENVDVVILETGLGGRLDATNVIKAPILTIITSINEDHEAILGDNIDKIASEKGGIIKENTPVIILKTNKGFDVIKKIAEEKHASLIKTENNFKIIDKEKNILSNDKNTYELSLRGLWNAENLSLVLSSIDLLKEKGFTAEQKAVREALKNTKWPSRFEFIPEKNIIIDGAHNPASAKKLRESLDFYFPGKERLWLYGCLNTKDYKKIIKILFKDADVIILTDNFAQNAINCDILEKEILKNFSNVKIYKSSNIKNAIKILFKNNSSSKTATIAGSLYLTGCAINELNDNFCA